ncbi:hypothetical protein GJAV_G00039570 [Gymnothorax javanicus]|nr:hypothetical protein GJAV_G00039570 [Gymnothorax javanicus]
MLDQLRLKGNYLHNIQVLEKGQGQIVTCRQPSGEASAHDYLPCNICYGFFLKDDLWKHEDFCRKRMGKPAEKSKKRKRVQAAASCLIPYKGAASGRCRKILNRMMIDDVSIEVKSDPLICEFGDRLLEKHEGDTSKDGYVSQKMRELGRFVLAAKSLDHKVKRLQDILVPSKFQLTVQAAKKASGYANSKYRYDTPSLALKLGHSLKVVCDIVIGQHIKAEDEVAANRVRSYLRLIGSEWDRYVSRQTRTNSEDSKWNKTDMIPLTKDVMKLLKFLKSMEEEAKERLSAGPDPKEYRKLSESVLSQIVLFNRRRQGEAARMLLMTYRDRNTEVLPSDIVTFLSKLEQHLSHGFTTVVVRGKRGCQVPVLLTREMEASLAFLLEQRSEENDILDSNQYVFARQNSDSHLRGSDCLRKFAAACEAEFPETLTSTHLRKHVATLCQIMNLKEHELDQVAKYMGHDISVHREYYRLLENALQVAKICMILLAMELGPDVYKGKSLDEIDLSLNVGAEKPQNKLMDAEGNDCYRYTQDGWKEDFFSPKSFELPQDLDGSGTQMQKTAARPSEKDSEKTLTSGSSEQQMLKTSGPEESFKLPQDLDGAALVCAASRKAKRRPWSNLEKAAVYRQFGSFITLQKVPGKDLCLACLEAEPALHTRHWKDIKNQVHNLIQSNRNKLNS